jgi:hypothetical protein
MHHSSWNHRRAFYKPHFFHMSTGQLHPPTVEQQAGKHHGLSRYLGEIQGARSIKERSNRGWWNQSALTVRWGSLVLQQHLYSEVVALLRGKVASSKAAA